MTTDSLTLRFEIDATPATVFAALTEPDALTEWFAESAEVDLAANRFEFWGRYTPDGTQPRQRLLEAKPEQSLRLGWLFSDGTDSTVAITLAGIDGSGTELSLTQSPLPGGPLTDAITCFWYVSLSNLAAYSVGVATMPPFDFSAPAQGDAFLRAVIDVPAEEVYAALLNPAQVEKWAGGPVRIEAKAGGAYDYGGVHGATRILELEPDRLIVHDWRTPGSPDTQVRWQLRGSRGSTFLTLIHTGFDNDALAESYRQGWPSHLVELRRSLELGAQWRPLKV